MKIYQILNTVTKNNKLIQKFKADEVLDKSFWQLQTQN